MDGAGRKKLSLGLAVMALACLVLVLNWFYSSREKPRSRIDSRAVQAEMREVTFLHGRKGGLVWRLQSSRAELGKNRKIVSLIDPEITYAVEGNQTLVASSAQGRYNRANRTAAFWPGVSGTYGAARFTAGRMEYCADRDSVELLQGVHVARGNASIRSTRAEVELGAKRVVFSRDAEVVLNAKSQ
jgi:hypothetical protein